jgi:DNA-binding NarL/FixJ family response regulator
MQADSNPIKVLLADNSRPQLKKLAKLVQGAPGMELSGAVQNGYEAVSHAAHGEPDVVLMEIEMESKQAGLYATREILKLRPAAKVIIHTSRELEYFVIKAFQFGACDYVIKGVSDQEILDTITRASENRSMIHPEAARLLLRRFIQLQNAQENQAYTMKALMRLTPAEMEILRMLRSGMKYQEIAKVRFVEMTTMKTHISNMLRKFEHKSVAELLETVENTGFFLMIDEPK